MPHRIAEFIYSQQMETSEMKKRAINLGRAIVEELGLEPGVDTLSRWMAHYAAEQIASAESCEGEQKTNAEQRCFETILKLWRHHASFPSGRRPFESFEPIFRALNALDPQNPRSYYFDDGFLKREKNTQSADPEKVDVVQSWIDTALGVDRGARVLIDFAFRNAALQAIDNKTQSLINNAAKLVDDEEMKAVVRLISEVEREEEEKAPNRVRRRKQEKLQNSIEKLEILSSYSRNLRVELEKELENLSKEYGNK